MNAVFIVEVRSGIKCVLTSAIFVVHDNTLCLGSVGGGSQFGCWNHASRATFETPRAAVKVSALTFNYYVLKLELVGSRVEHKG